MQYSQIEEVFDSNAIDFSKEDLDRLIEQQLATQSIQVDRCKDWDSHMKTFAAGSIQNDFFFETKR